MFIRMVCLMKRNFLHNTFLVHCGVVFLLLIALIPCSPSLASDQNADLTELTLEELMDIEVVTPSRII
jgi:hypothetical protein